MNYKKGILSVVLWFIYAMTAGTGLVGTAMIMLLPEGVSRSIGLVIAGVWLAVTGLVVFLLHRLLEKKRGQQREDLQKSLLVLEGVLFAALAVVGIVLRARQVMQYDGAGNVWFDTVKVTETTQIPQVVHGAVYFYLQVLHGLLVFLGNKITAALILQVVLQIFTGIFFYFAVRKLTGTAAAIVAFGYWMLSPAVTDAVVLGPEDLYLLLWMIGLCAVAEALEHFRQKGSIPGIRSLIGFFASGIIIGVLGYLDVMGFLLLLILMSVLFLETKRETGLFRRISAVLLGLLGTAAGFFFSIALDAAGSGKLMGNVLSAWWKVCEPKKISLAVTYMESAGQKSTFSVMAAVFMEALFCLGAFSYWCRKKRERQSVWIAVMVVLTVLICAGMTGVEMQGLSLLTLFVAAIDGAGVQAILPWRERDVIQMLEKREEQETKDAPSPGRHRLKVRDLETEELPEEESRIQYIENPLPLPKKHVPKVLDYKLNSEDGDFDYPVAEDDDFDH